MRASVRAIAGTLASLPTYIHTFTLTTTTAGKHDAPPRDGTYPSASASHRRRRPRRFLPGCYRGLRGRNREHPAEKTRCRARARARDAKKIVCDVFVVVSSAHIHPYFCEREIKSISCLAK